MSLAHGNDLSLHSAVHDVPETLINHERRLPMVTSVLVRLRNNPRGGIRDALRGRDEIRQWKRRAGRSETYQVEHFPSLNERVEAIHHLFDGGLPIPPVDVENIDIRRPEVLQACLQAEMHRLDIVPRVHHLLSDVVVPAHVI